MQYTIFKSLDNPSSMVGLKGSYLKFALMGIGIALLIAGVVGSLTNGLIGIIVFIAIGAAVYLGVMAFQAKFSERERGKWFSSRKTPDVIHFAPLRFPEYASKYINESKEKTKPTG